MILSWFSRKKKDFLAFASSYSDVEIGSTKSKPSVIKGRYEKWPMFQHHSKCIIWSLQWHSQSSIMFLERRRKTDQGKISSKECRKSHQMVLLKYYYIPLLLIRINNDPCLFVRPNWNLIEIHRICFYPIDFSYDFVWLAGLFFSYFYTGIQFEHTFHFFEQPSKSTLKLFSNRTNVSFDDRFFVSFVFTGIRFVIQSEFQKKIEFGKNARRTC